MDYRLEELIDVNLLQSLQEKLNDIYSFPSAIIDNDGNVLTAVAWQDICTKFHRINPESEKECIKSDQYIIEHLQDAKPAVSYKCPHGLIDNATPIIIEGKHLGNFFTGQFFVDEKPEIEFFIQQAEKFGFDKEEYLEAVNKVPVWTRSKLIQYLDFIKSFIEIIAGIGLKNLKEIEANKRIKENERLLEEERLRLSYIFEGTNVGTWEWNIKTGETIFNERWAEIIGYTLEEISPVTINTWIKFAHPDDFKKSGALLQRHFDGELEYYEHESRMKHKNGNWVWILDKGKVFERDINGEPVRMAGTHQDITGRKKAEEALRISEERYALLIHNLEAGIVVHAPDTSIVDCNQRASEILGLSCDQIKGKSAIDPGWRFVNENGAPLPLNEYPVNRILEDKKPIKDQLVGMRQDSRPDIVWALVNGFPIFNNNGEMAEVVVSFFDITKRKQIEFELSESSERFKALHNASFGGIAIHDKGIILECNQGLSDMTGYSIEELIGMNGLLLIAPEHRELVMSNITAGYVKPYETTGLRKNGEPFPVRLEARNIPYKGKNVRTVEFRDLTESKIAEEALRRSESIKNTMVSNIGDVIVIIDKEGINRYKSPNITKFFGWKPEELIGKNTWDNIHPDDQERGQKFFSSILSEPNASGTTELRYKRKDGNYVWIEIKVNNLLHDKDINGILGNYHDITDRKLAEETLRQTEQRLRLANKATNDVIWEWDVIRDMQQWNEAGIAVFGWTEIVEHQVNADWWVQKVHPDDRQRVHDSFFSVVNNPLSDVWTDEYRFLKSDGSYADVLDRGYVQRNEQGAAVRMVGAMLDITARKRAEEEIIKAKENAEESERKLKEAQEIAKLGSWELDIKTGIFTFNDNFYKIFHTTAGEMGGYQMSIEDYSKRFVHPDDASKVADETRAAIESGDPDFSRYVEHRILYADGGTGYISVKFFIVKDDHGNTIKTYGVNQDISARKVLEEKLIKSEAEFRNAFEYSPIGIALVSPEGKFLNVNQRVCDIVGYTKDELIKLSFQHITHPDDLNADLDFVEKMLKNEIITYQMEKRYFKKNGQIAWVLLVVSLVKDKLGMPLHFISQIKDITERKLAEEALRASDIQHRMVLHTAMDGFWLVDLDGRIREVNQSYVQSSGYSESELLSMNVNDLEYFETHRETKEHIQKVISEGKGRFESKHRRKDGSVFDVEVSTQYLPLEGGFLVVFLRDITERKREEIELEKHRNNLEELVKIRTEELERANESLKTAVDKERELNALKSRFISTASHELRTPLTTAYMSIELIERYSKKWDENKISEHHKRIKSSVEYLTQIVESLLTMSRAEAGKIDFKPKKTDIAGLCNQLVDGLKISDREAHSIKLTCPDSTKQFNVDSSLLNTILLNLLSNSIKYSPAESPIELLINESENKLVIAVNDRGIGIPENDLPHIFEPFHRGENINEARGTGLGLAIVKNAVDLHGGNIRVESQVGKGTSFIVELPV